MTDQHTTWTEDEIQPLPLEWIDERLHRYRLQDAKREQKIVESLERYGQVSPVIICRQEEAYVLIDGFKRLRAARTLKGMTQTASPPGGGGPAGSESGHLQLEPTRPARGGIGGIVDRSCVGTRRRPVASGSAQLLGRHKSWVCRRLAMLERLCEAAREELRLGLLTPAPGAPVDAVAARQPSCSFTNRSRGVSDVPRTLGAVDLLLASSTQAANGFRVAGSTPRTAPSR